jgi:hypothetical protein
VTTSSGEAPKGPNAPGLTRIRKPKGPWRCRVCSYWPNLDSRSPHCLQCGRDFWGNPGTIPDLTRPGWSDRQFEHGESEDLARAFNDGFNEGFG